MLFTEKSMHIYSKMAWAPETPETHFDTNLWQNVSQGYGYSYWKWQVLIKTHLRRFKKNLKRRRQRPPTLYVQGFRKYKLWHWLFQLKVTFILIHLTFLWSKSPVSCWCFPVFHFSSLQFYLCLSLHDGKNCFVTIFTFNVNIIHPK